MGELFRVEEGSQSSSVERKLASAIINLIAPCVFHTKQIIITLKNCTYVFKTCIQTPSLYATFIVNINSVTHVAGHPARTFGRLFIQS